MSDIEVGWLEPGKITDADGNEIHFTTGRGHGFWADSEGTTTYETNERGERENGVFTPHPPATTREVSYWELVRQERSCRVYWGSHGCHLECRHPGRHQCYHDDWEPEEGETDADSYGYGWGTYYYGEDAPRFQPMARLRRITYSLSRWRRRLSPRWVRP